MIFPITDSTRMDAAKIRRGRQPLGASQAAGPTRGRAALVLLALLGGLAMGLLATRRGHSDVKAARGSPVVTTEAKPAVTTAEPAHGPTPLTGDQLPRVTRPSIERKVEPAVPAVTVEESLTPALESMTQGELEDLLREVESALAELSAAAFQAMDDVGRYEVLSGDTFTHGSEMNELVWALRGGAGTPWRKIVLPEDEFPDAYTLHRRKLELLRAIEEREDAPGARR